MSAIESLTKEREIKFSCEQCYLKLSTSGSLRKHTLAVHEGVKFDCEECTKKFSTKTNLTRHKNVFHTISKLTDKPYNCKQCFKYFNQKSNLQMHMGVHAKVRAYICPECKIDFTTKYHQRRHFSKQHGSIYEKTYLHQSSKTEWKEISLKRNVTTQLNTSTINKKSALSAVKTVKLNHVAKADDVKNTFTLANILLERKKKTPRRHASRTEVLRLTNIGRVARQGCSIRSLARRSSKTVDEGKLLERVRGLEHVQVQAMLERRGSRLAISMDWVVRLCMVERGESGLQEGRDTWCPCGKVFKEFKSIQTHQQWCIVAWGKKGTEPPATLSAWQSLAFLTPRLLQGTMSLQGVGRQAGLHEEVVRAWRDSIRRCLPVTEGVKQKNNLEI